MNAIDLGMRLNEKSNRLSGDQQYLNLVGIITVIK